MMFKNFLAAAAMMGSALAAIQLTSWPTSGVVAGTPYTITWIGGDSTPVTLLLRQGPSTDLSTVGTITSTGSGGSYTWTPDSSLPNGPDYAIEIVQGTDINYSGLFSYSGGSAAQPSVSASYSVSVASVPASSSVIISVSSSAVLSTPSIAVYNTTSTKSTSTVSSTSKTLTTSTKTTSETAAATSATPHNSASGFSSPIALVMGAIAAIFYLQ